ncbi:hypothetical protein NU10_04020 [Flavobacterium dauae]|uniref:hypothetical protein n=1 Tax=Flavobacterium dauae TaxID=1563479 RepID=UPI00101B2624|nr:hypothetical protein [Flavobacterium dauae]WLD24574.1 hypothetical protein NU10_04020 [Flavobacterium dauae]
MKKKLFLFVFLGMISILGCNDDNNVQANTLDGIVPLNVTYTNSGESGLISYDYDTKNRITNIEIHTNKRNISILFAYNNELLVNVNLIENARYKANYDISYSGNKVFIEESSLHLDYPDNIRQVQDTITIDSNKYFVNGSNNMGSKTSCSYDHNSNISKISDVHIEMTYDSKNGMFKNVNNDQWIFVYFLRSFLLGETFLNYNNNCTQIKDVRNYKMTYNENNFPIKIHDSSDNFQVIEYSISK